MGYGISLQALQRNAEAGAAFGRALESNRLSPELQAFVRQRLKELLRLGATECCAKAQP